MTDVKIINFMGVRKIASVLSVVMLVVSIGALFINGLNYGLDFTGGTQVELSFDEPADLNEVRDVMEEQGFENYEVVLFGSDTEVLVRIQDTGNEEMDPNVAAAAGNRIVDLISERTDGGVELAGSEYIGSVVGDELKEQGGLGLIVALAMMLIYISLRFQFKFALATVAALTEDIIITIGFFAITQLTFDLTVLAALLAVIGYGLNDTVVICDRIRENFRTMRKTPSSEIIDISLSQTMARTIITSSTTLLVLITLTLLGGETLRGFSIALIVGVIIGTYSSIFVATNVLLRLNLQSVDLIPPEKEGEDAEEVLP